MKLKHILNCTRRTYFEVDGSDYVYCGTGTAFLCRYRNRDYAVVASHSIRGISPDTLRICFSNAGREFLPIHYMLVPEAPTKDDDEWLDWRVLRLNKDQYDGRTFGDGPPYDLSDGEVWRPSDTGGTFIARGYQTGLAIGTSFIDYDTKQLHEQAVIVEASYVRATDRKLVHEIRFPDLSHCQTLDGVSGAGLFWVDDRKRPMPHKLAGILHRATLSSCAGYFIEGTLLLDVLRRDLAQHP